MRLLLAICFALIPTMANATTYYTDKAHGSASDSNACTSESLPCLTISGGLGKLSTGDTLTIKAGTYDETITQAQVPDGVSSGNPTILIGESGTIIHPVDTPGGNPGVWLQGANITIDTIAIDGSSATGNIVQMDGSNLIIQNSEVYGSRSNVEGSNACIVLGGGGGSGSGSKVLNNKIHDCNDTSSSPFYSHGIYVGADSSGFLIEGNEVYNNTGYGIHLFHGTAITNTIVRKNYVHTNDVTGILIGSGDGNLAYNNVVTDNGSVGIQAAYEGAADSAIYNNTIYGNDICVFITSATGTIVKNNICYANATNSVVDNGTSSTIDNNLFVDPLFVNAAGGDFHLQSGSDAIDAGTDLSAVFTTDYEGTTRSGTWEIGAYNFTSTPIEALVLSLDFNEGSGLPQDSSGYGNHVTDLGSGNSWSAGHTGNGVTFGGTAYATIADSNSLDLSTAFTLEAWVKPTTTPSTYAAIMVKDYVYYIYSANDGTFCGGNGPIGGYSVSGDVVVCQTAGLTQDAWSHIAVTYDSTLGSANVTLYINGSVVDTIDATATLTATSGVFSIGGASFGAYFTGIIDDVKVYTYARTAEQICTDGCGVAARQVGPIFLFY